MPILEGLRRNHGFVARLFESLRKIHVDVVYHNVLDIPLRLLYPKPSVPNVSKIYGDNFKEYFINHNMPQVIKALKEGLDDNSEALVNDKINNFLNLPSKGSKYDLYAPFAYYKQNRSKAQLAEYKAYQGKVPYLQKKYPGDFSFQAPGGQYRAPESFYYHHGLKLVDKSVLDYIKGKVFLDCGACWGDSSVVFNEYNPSKVYSFEMSLSCKEHYYQNLRLNNADTDKFIFVNKGVSNKNTKLKLSKEEYASMTMAKPYEVKEDDCFVDLVKIDDFCNEHKIGLIQMDIEGAEYNAVLGAKETIKRDKPLLLITIYHTPQQFFELKPLIESWNLGYTFIIRDLSPLGSETTLMGIPNVVQG